MSRSPASGISTSYAAVSAVLLAMWAYPVFGFDERTGMREAIRAGLPSYDPKIRASHLALVEAQSKPNADAAKSYGVKEGPTDTAGSAAQPAEVVTLPRLIVRPTGNTEKLEPAVQLPRLMVHPPANDVKPEEFETPAARDARLVKKHLTVFDRMILNRFTLPLFGISKEARARKAEAIEHSATALNEIADLIDVTESEKGETEQDRQLKELYLEVFVARPK